MYAEGYENVHARHFSSGHRDSPALFTYGSLLVRRELMEVFSVRRVSVRPARVEGLRRDFNVDIGRWLEDPPPGRTGVLNVREDPEGWCNGLLVLNVTPAGLRHYAEREFGYRLIRLEDGRVHHHSLGGSRWPAGTDIYTCHVPERHTNDRLSAYPSYRERCVRGARSWGPAFYRDFLESTFSGGRRLAEGGREPFRTS